MQEHEKDALIREIAARIAKHKDQQAWDEEFERYLAALAKVYSVDEDTVRHLADQAITARKRETKPPTAKLILPWVAIGALLLIGAATVWLLYRNLNPADSEARSADVNRQVNAVQDALASINVLKISVLEHYQVTGQYPSTFEEIGLRESDFVLSGQVERLTLQPGGEIVVTNVFSDGATIRLQPYQRIASEAFDWRCLTTLPETVTAAIDGCTGESS